MECVYKMTQKTPEETCLGANTFALHRIFFLLEINKKAHSEYFHIKVDNISGTTSHPCRLFLFIKVEIVLSFRAECQYSQQREDCPVKDTNLCKSNKKQLMIRHSQGRQHCFLAVLFDPVHIGLQSNKLSCYTHGISFPSFISACFTSALSWT